MERVRLAAVPMLREAAPMLRAAPAAPRRAATRQHAALLPAGPPHRRSGLLGRCRRPPAAHPLPRLLPDLPPPLPCAPRRPAGKSTLMNLLAGDLTPTQGEQRRSHKLRVGRYAQHFVDALKMDETPVDYLLSRFPESGGWRGCSVCTNVWGRGRGGTKAGCADLVCV